MSEAITLKQQVAFMTATLNTCETSYPIRVEMGRMTKVESERRLSKMRAILETLRKAEAAGGVAESALKEMAPAPRPEKAVGPDLTVIVHEIHRCAQDHADKCEHCAAIANILDENGSVV
jgi:hypothetical protein